MHHFIDDLLALSRLGRLQIRTSVTNLTAMARQVFDQLRAQAPERDLQLSLSDLPPGLGDQSLLYQVMQNLLGNAVKFTSYKEVAIIEVGGRSEGKENIYYIKDNGPGLVSVTSPICSAPSSACTFVRNTKEPASAWL